MATGANLHISADSHLRLHLPIVTDPIDVGNIWVRQDYGPSDVLRVLKESFRVIEQRFPWKAYVVIRFHFSGCDPDLEPEHDSEPEPALESED